MSQINTTSSPTPKRLRRIREGAVLSGICNGIADYFDIDVTIVRASFVLLAIVTSGAVAFAYLALTFVIPSADAEQRTPVTGAWLDAQELIDQIKKHCTELSRVLRSRDRNERRNWRRQFHDWFRKEREAGRC